MKAISKGILIVVVLLSAVLLAMLQFAGYEQTIGYITSISARNKSSRVLYGMITPAKFQFLKILLAIFILLLLFIIQKFKKIYAYLRILLLEIITLFKKIKDILLQPGLGYILILPLAASVYYAITIPINYDEAITYEQFTSKNPIFSLTLYPFPNNHVLHSIITNFTRYLPFSALVNMRISPIIVNFFTWSIAFMFIAEFYSKKTALVITAISAVLFMNIYYGFMSRGYSMVNLFFVSALYAAYKLIQNNRGKHYWVWFTLSSTLGFCTMPSFLYPFLILNLFILLYSPKSIVKQTMMGFITAGAVVLFYTPIIFLNGIGVLTKNEYVKPISRLEVLENLPHFFSKTIHELTGFNWIWLVALFLISLIFCIIFRKFDQIRETFILLIPIPIILILHSVIPFPRTFVFGGFLLTFLFLKPFSIYFDRMNNKILLASTILLQLLFALHFNQTIIPYEEREPQINITVENINRQIIGNKNYLCDGALMGTNLMFKVMTEQYNDAHIEYIKKPLNADTVQQYNYVIIARYLDSTRQKKPKFSTFYFSVYTYD